MVGRGWGWTQLSVRWIIYEYCTTHKNHSAVTEYVYVCLIYHRIYETLVGAVSYVEYGDGSDPVNYYILGNKHPLSSNFRIPRYQGVDP